MRSLATLGLGLTLVLARGPAARADDEAPPAASGEVVHHVVPPPAPSEQRPELLLGIRGAAIVPLVVDGLCPSGHECVMNAGVGIGVTIEQRWPNRFGLLLSYDAWVVDSDALFEIGLAHSFRVGARYVLDDSASVHPYLEIHGAFLAFGDTAQVSAIGGALTVGGGAEIEITESIALLTDVELWTLATGSFATRDGVRRSDGFGANLVLQIGVALEVLLGST